MSFITISRGTFSGGKLLAEALSQKLGFRCIDRDTLVQRAAARGISQRELLAALATPPASALGTLNHRKYLYLVHIQAALAEEVGAGHAIYHGLVGHLLLHEGLPVLRLRIIAPLEFRIRMVRQNRSCSQSEAVEHIAKIDDERRRWTLFLYGVGWDDPSLYDLVINMAHITIEQACRLVAGMICEPPFASSPEHATALDDFKLATRARVALAQNPLTSNLEVDVRSARGELTVRGELFEQDADVERVAREIPGVVGVTLEDPASAGPA
jgi:cytidylate kinase